MPFLEDWSSKINEADITKSGSFDKFLHEILLVFLAQAKLHRPALSEEEWKEVYSLAFSKISSLSTEECTEAYLLAIATDSRALKYISKDVAGYKEILLKAIEWRPVALLDVPKDHKNYEDICLEAVKKNGLALEYVAKNTANYVNIGIEAVKQNGLALEYVNKDTAKYEHICLAAVKQNGLALEYVDKDTANYEVICLAAVKQDGLALEYVDKDTANYEVICLAAVKQDGLALEYIDKDTLKYVAKDTANYVDICLAAVKQNGNALKLVDRDMLEYVAKNTEVYRDICFAAVKQDGLALEYVDKDTANYAEICLATVTQNGRALRYVDRDTVKDKYAAICLAAVKQNGCVLEDISNEVENYAAICFEAVKQDGLALKYVVKDPTHPAYPANYKDICFAAVTQNWRALEYISIDHVVFSKAQDVAQENIVKNIVDDQPVVIMLYDPEGGVIHADQLIEYLSSINVKPILVSSTNALLYPLLQSEKINKIDGIILPGGPDIEATAQRTKTEIKLLEAAIANKIPTLGICRGHQLIGQYFGGKVETMETVQTMGYKPYQHHEGEIIIQPKGRKDEPESKLYATLERHTGKEKENKFVIPSTCRHNQALFFPSKKESPKRMLDPTKDNTFTIRDKSQVRVVARAKDGTIEAMEIYNHIITFQHHHENKLDEIGKTLLNIYNKMVMEHCQQKERKVSFRRP